MEKQKNSIRVMHLALNSAYEDNPISEAFRQEGYTVFEIDWIQLFAQHKENASNFGRNIIDAVNTIQPNFIFMQIQHGGVIDYPTAHALCKLVPVISWTGDVRNEIEWHRQMAAAGVLCLFNNDEDIETIRKEGYKADYLQISFPNAWFPYNKAKGKSEDSGIVFMGNNYLGHKGLDFPLSLERLEMCQALHKEFGDYFKIYGNGWEEKGLPATPVHPALSGDIYYQCHIAISHSHYMRSRYTSDRLFYMLACGAFVLAQWYPNIEQEFIDGKHLRIWKTIPELLDLCKKYLPTRENSLEWQTNHERILIAQQGREFVHKHCTWINRIQQLTELIFKYYPTAMEKNDNWVPTLHGIAPEKKYSQFGEEAYIGHIFNCIGTTNKFFVEFGAGDGFNLSNTRLFKESFGWNGLQMDYDTKDTPDVMKEFITKDNICELLKKYEVPELFDLLSIDVDGNDYWILEALLKEYTPRVIVAEFNGTIPMGIDKTIEYNPEHIWQNDDHYGASLDAFRRLGYLHGYALIFCNASTNLYLVRNEELLNPFADFGVRFEAAQYHAHNSTGKWVGWNSVWENGKFIGSQLLYL